MAVGFLSVLALLACCGGSPGGVAALSSPARDRRREAVTGHLLGSGTRQSTPSSSVGDVSEKCTGSGASNDGVQSAAVRRRIVLAGFSAASTFLSAQSAAAIENPLNLKGAFWETGRLYEKSKDLPPDDDADFFSILEATLEALHSPTLTEAVAEGRYGQASRLLRGGLVSESRVRLAANALIDSLPEEDDGAIYRSGESFRVFLRYLDALDAEVEAASRPFAGGGGEGDPRMGILARMGEAEGALRSLLKNLRGGLEGGGRGARE